MQFAHRVSNVSGGNKVVTVTTVAGKGLVKVTMVPTGTAKAKGISQKELIQVIKWSNEKALREEAAK